jgi:hypothetical protein
MRNAEDNLSLAFRVGRELAAPPGHQLESQLPAAEVTLTADILDQIDQLVPPGVTINPDDNSYGEAELTLAALRRTP